MSRPRHIRAAQKAAAQARFDAMTAADANRYRRGASQEIRRRKVEEAAMTPAERKAAERRLFERYGGPLALLICVFGPLADTIARSMT